MADIGRDGAPRLEPDFARTAGVNGNVDVRASDVRWTRGGDEVGTKALSWHGVLGVSGTRRTVDSHLDVDALRLALGPTEIAFTGIREDSSVVVSGDLSSPTTELTQHATVRAVRQNLAPEYPIGDVTFAVAAERERWGLVHVKEATLSNAAGGTSLTVSGNAELGAGRHTLALKAALAQDLAHLSRARALQGSRSPGAGSERRLSGSLAAPSGSGFEGA